MVIRFVERPISESEEQKIALVETSKNGKAIVIQLNGRTANNVQNSLRYSLEKRGYKFHYRSGNDRESMICWTEAKKK